MDHKQEVQCLSCVLVLNYGINTKGWKEQERKWFARSCGSNPLAIDGRHAAWGPVPPKRHCVWMTRLFPPDQRCLGKSLLFLISSLFPFQEDRVNIAQSLSRVWLCDPQDCSPPGSSSVYGIAQARVLEWLAISSSRGSSRPRDWTQGSGISCIGR